MRSITRRGFALITVLAVLIMVVLGAAAILNTVAGHSNIKSRSVQALKAQYLAEAGMQWAIWDCKNNPGPSCGVAAPESPILTVDRQSVSVSKAGTPGNYTFVVNVQDAVA